MPVLSLDGVAPELPAPGDYWIAPTATVIGRVRLGRDVGVWYGAVLRGDNELIDIGEGTNVQEHCVLHTDPGVPLTVGRGCTVGHRALLHGCTLGDNCLIGIGATILNRSVIGPDCLIGAHALIPEGKTIPARSLVIGTPGKPVRELTDAEVEGLRRSAEGYVRNWRRFAAGLRPVDG
jgi:carbonic anhydrase/acetyltransferase-like protein (isoleucine patch superfamily)